MVRNRMALAVCVVLGVVTGSAVSGWAGPVDLVVLNKPLHAGRISPMLYSMGLMRPAWRGLFNTTRSTGPAHPETAEPVTTPKTTQTARAILFRTISQPPVA